MLRLLMNAQVFAPEALERQDILLAGGKIARIAPRLDHFREQAEIQKEDMAGCFLCPALVDAHVHITGGGGELGPASRMPELFIQDFVMNGVGTVLGLTGTDGVSRGMESLLLKAAALESQGLTVRLLTGHYGYPTTTLLGSVQRDLALLDKVIGVKVAISDHRGSAVLPQELARLALDARVGGMLGGKPGITVMHIGASKRRLAPVFEALEHSDLPAGNLVATHCERSPELLDEAAALTRLGGWADLTADDEFSAQGSAKSLMDILQMGANPNKLSISSDAGGSLPVFDANNACIGITQANSRTLLIELRRLVQQHNLGLEAALPYFTSNPARLLGLGEQKGQLKEGFDADILALDGELKPWHLYLAGKARLVNGQLKES